MDDLGAPISYLVLEQGADVYSSDGEKLGKVIEVRADTRDDIFDGIVIGHHSLLPPRRRADPRRADRGDLRARRRPRPRELMAVREASAADLEALAPLLRGYTDFYESTPTDEGLVAMARDVIAAPEDRAFLLVATDERDQIVGFALNQWKWSSLRGARVVVMDDLFIAESARGAGHADALIEAVAEVASRHRAPIVSWFTMPDNKRAHAVYERVGGTAETLLEYELEL